MLKENRKKVYIALIVIVVLALAGAVYLTFFYVPQCQNYECWQKYMSRCSKATFINDEAEASWKYEVEGSESNQCVISVELLMAKQGELGIEKLGGEEMSCSYPMGATAYAEKDLSKCHGLLKEELQTMMITKLHSYILENLGKIEEGLEGI
jgi:hypothetical protein